MAPVFRDVGHFSVHPHFSPSPGRRSRWRIEHKWNPSMQLINDGTVTYAFPLFTTHDHCFHSPPLPQVVRVLWNIGSCALFALTFHTLLYLCREECPLTLPLNLTLRPVSQCSSKQGQERSLFRIHYLEHCHHPGIDSGSMKQHVGAKSLASGLLQSGTVPSWMHKQAFQVDPRSLRAAVFHYQ